MKTTWVWLISLVAVLWTSAFAGVTGSQVLDGKSAVDDLRALCASTSNNGRLAVLKKMLFDRGLRYSVERVRPMTAFVIPQPPDGHNVIVTLGGGPEDIVVCAHFDAARIAGGTLSKGAVDNGAAVVALVMLAETLSREKLPCRVRILFTDKEEASARGSNRFVWDHRRDPIKAAIVVDVVASHGAIYYHAAAPPDPAPEKVSGFPPRTVKSKPDMKRLTEAALQKLGIPGISAPKPSYTDQGNFSSAGIPSVWLAVLPESQAHQMWLAENSPDALAEGLNDWTITKSHSPEDNPDAVTPEAMETVYQVVLELVRQLDGK